MVRLHYATANGQTQAGTSARPGPRPVHAIESIADQGQMLRRYPRAGIFDRDNHFAVFCSNLKRDATGLRCPLNCILGEVGEQTNQVSFISMS